MLKRNLLIGSLVAGVFVLPSVAAAGIVQGVCSGCHTMHASQNGSNGVGLGRLLVGTGCVGCHADGAENVITTGLGDGATGAPQVDGDGTGFINAAGYFNIAAADNLQHNVLDLGDNTDAAMTGTIPGTSQLYAGNQVTCEGCHTQAGHHTAVNYRMLGTAAATLSPNQYHPNAAGVFPGDRSAISYNANAMNQVCAACHSTFHGTGNTNAASPFVRHPTNIDVSVSTGASIVAALVATDAVVGGTNDGGVDGSDVVMCLSCHVAHGGNYPDLLSFDYTTNLAGGLNVATEGCETCHSYGGNGM